MLVRGVRTEHLDTAALAVSVSLYNLRPVGHGFRFQLHLGPPVSKKRGPGRYHWQRVGQNERRIAAVCWHGHREFFRAVYRQVPTAIFVTRLTRYENAEHFESTFGDTGGQNIGSEYFPTYFSDACDCGDSDSGTCAPSRPATRPIPGYVWNDEEPDLSGSADHAVPSTPYGTDDESRWAEYNRKFCAMVSAGK